MRLKSILFILLQFCYAFSGAQKFSSHPIALTPEKEEHVYFNDSLYKKSLTERYKGEFNLQIRYDDFVQESLEEAKKFYNGDLIYTNLKKEVTYLEDLVKEVIPPGYKKDHIKVYIRKDPSINAFCLEDGAISINIGMLAVLNSEAEIASILAHEYGHYYYKHAKKVFKKNKNTILWSYMFGRAAYFKFAHDQRQMERESDFMSVKLFSGNRFSVKAIPVPYQRIYFSEKLQLQKTDYKKTFSVFYTHPATKKRIQYLVDTVKKIKFSSQHDFQLDSIKFKELKKTAIDECIYFYFEHCNYSECLKLSYKLHLEYPEDEFYIFFILESLRRQMKLFPSFNYNNFITENYRFKNKSDKDSLKNRTLQSIHFHLKNMYEFTDSTLKALPNKTLTNNDNIEFITNKEALAYFTKLAVEKCRGCYPSLIKLGTKNIIQQDTNRSELATYLLDQCSFENPVKESNKEIAMFFFNNAYLTKKKTFNYTVKPITKGSAEFDEFKKFRASKSPQHLAELDSVVNFDAPLNYRENTTINSILNVISEKFIYDDSKFRFKIRKRHVYKNTTKSQILPLDAFNDLPELFLMTKKNNSKKIFFVDFLETDKNNRYKLQNKKTLNVILYCVEINKKIVYRFYKKFNFKYFDKAEYANFYPLLINYVAEINKKIDY